jgi:hypothetical protein
MPTITKEMLAEAETEAGTEEGTVVELQEELDRLKADTTMKRMRINALKAWEKEVN